MSGAKSRRYKTTRSKSPDINSGGLEKPGLRRIVQKRILEDVFQNAATKHPGWKVLVLDDHATRVISSAVGMYDIMEKKISTVENLNKKRAPFPDMAAIYFLDPCGDSIAKLLADWSGKKPLYGTVFLYFLGRLPDKLLNHVKQCRSLLKRVKGLVEINIDFLTIEERAFDIDMRKSFPEFYLRQGTSPVELKLAEKLVTVCATLNEYPHIRYRNSSAIATSLASVFHLKMDEYVAQNPSWWYHGGPTKATGASRDRGVLLILDRSDDCLTPLMHDFTYQPMVHDLLKMEGDRITFQSESKDDPSRTEAKDVLLDEKDPLWVEIRGKHIAAVIESLSSRIREIMNSSTGTAFGKKKQSGNMSISQMAAAMKALPEYREVMSKLSQHMHISHECMDVFKRDGLYELSDLEQTLATGKDEDGRSPKMNAIVDEVERELQKMSDPVARLRLILIATVSQGGLRQQDRRRLKTAAGLSATDTRTLNSLEVLGLSIFASTEKNRLSAAFSGGRLSSASAADEESEYAASRYVPPLKGILSELASNQLSFEEYPSVLPMPESSSVPAPASSRASARSSRSKTGGTARKSSGPSSRWSKSTAGDTKRSTGPTHLSGGRLLAFMMGGMSYPELRVAREVMAKESREVIVGSTAFLTAKDFISDLSLLGRDEY